MIKLSQRKITAGEIFFMVVLLLVWLLLFNTTTEFSKELDIDLSNARSYIGEVTERKTSETTGKWNDKNVAFNLSLKGMNQSFRFFNNTNDFSELLKWIQPGDTVKVYYSPYGHHLYQIEKGGRILFDKKIYESKQIPGFVMAVIFLMISTAVIIFKVKRLLGGPADMIPAAATEESVVRITHPHRLRTREILYSVIVFSYNQKDLTERCIRSIRLKLKTYPHEIIVVDKGSTDGTVEMIQKKFRNIILVENPNGVDRLEAFTQGRQQSSGKYTLHLNSDETLDLDIKTDLGQRHTDEYRREFGY